MVAFDINFLLHEERIDCDLTPPLFKCEVWTIGIEIVKYMKLEFFRVHLKHTRNLLE